MRQAAFSKPDLLMVLDRLREIYGLDGAPLLPEVSRKPRPVLMLGGRRVLGPPIDPSRLRYLEPLPHRRKVLAVDASAKVLFDLGPFKLVEAKVVVGIWRGLSRLYVYGPKKRLALISSREEGAEWLLRIEVEAAAKLSKHLGRGDYVLLDRSLSAPPMLRRSTRELFDKLDRKLSSRGAVLVGITKRSRLSLNTGEGLIGYLISLADRVYKGLPWYYHPVFREVELPPWFLGDLAVAKFSEACENAFRVDISRRALEDRPVSVVVAELAYLQDMATPGYPYPLKAVHDMARISEHELGVDRLLFLEALSEVGLEKRFLASVRSASFKERYLWGDSI